MVLNSEQHPITLSIDGHPYSLDTGLSSNDMDFIYNAQANGKVIDGVLGELIKRQVLRDNKQSEIGLESIFSNKDNIFPKYLKAAYEVNQVIFSSRKMPLESKEFSPEDYFTAICEYYEENLAINFSNCPDLKEIRDVQKQSENLLEQLNNSDSFRVKSFMENENRELRMRMETEEAERKDRDNKAKIISNTEAMLFFLKTTLENSKKTTEENRMISKKTLAVARWTLFAAVLFGIPQVNSFIEIIIDLLKRYYLKG
jgi:hypothetical protein